MHIALEILIILLLLGANGLFAMSEIAVVSSRKTRLQQRAAAGDTRAARALELANDPNRFLPTVQIGITTVGIFAGAFGGATIARQIADLLRGVDVLAPYAQVLGIVLVVAMITYATLVLGELAPKRIALFWPERIAGRVAGPMDKLSRVATPLVRLLGASTDLVLRAVPWIRDEEPAVTADDVRVLLEQGTRAGVFLAAEQDIVENVFWLGDQRVDSVMTPRERIICVDAGASPQAQLTAMTGSPQARYVLVNGSLDAIIGVVSMKDLWPAALRGEAPDLREHAFAPLYVPRDTRALTVLEQFRKTGIHIAMVHDEDDFVVGLVTLTDILEGLVGELVELAEDQVVQREDGSWLVSGAVLMEDVMDLLGLRASAGDGSATDRGDARHTVAEFVTASLGRTPDAAEYVVWKGYRFEVVDLDGRRIDKVLVAPEPDPPAGPFSREPAGR
jgi:putative hemolysin